MRKEIEHSKADELALTTTVELAIGGFVAALLMRWLEM